MDNLLPEHLEALRQNLTNTEWKVAQRTLSGTWLGNCSGFAHTSILAAYDLLNPSDYYDESELDGLYDSDDIISFDYRSAMEHFNQPVIEKSLITYYQFLQCKETYRQEEVYQYCYSTDEEKLQKLITLVESGKPVYLGLDGYFHGTASAHTVVAYDIEYGSWEFNGKTYDGKILLYDSSVPSEIAWESIPEEYDTWNMFFNSEDSSWYLPYHELDSANNGTLTMITTDVDFLNVGGILEGTQPYEANRDYIDVMTTTALESEATVTRAVTDGEVIRTAEALYIDGSFEADVDFFLPGEEDSYTLTLENSQDLVAYQYYENSMFGIRADNTQEVSFSPDGSLATHGTYGNYSFELVENEGYYFTDWDAVTISGMASDASVQLTEDGYIVTADDLGYVSLKGWNDTNLNDTKNTAVSLSTDANSILFYQINAYSVGAKADMDDDGIFETELTVSELGNLDDDAEINAKDASLVLIASAKEGAGLDSGLTDVQKFTADVNGDGICDAKDASYILQYSAEVGAGMEIYGMAQYMAEK